MLSHHGGKLLTSFTKQNTAPAVKDVTIEMIELPVTDDENTTQKSKEIHVIPKARVSNWVDENNSGDSSVSTDDVYVDENSGRRYSVTELGVSVWVDDTWNEEEQKEEQSIKSKRRSFIKVTNDEIGAGDYFQNIETGETVWEIPADGDLVEGNLCGRSD